jgi:hypothetical protein
MSEHDDDLFDRIAALRQHSLGEKARAVLDTPGWAIFRAQYKTRDKQTASQLIRMRMPHLDNETIEDLVKECPDIPTITAQVPSDRHGFPERSKFYACAWLCGASWRTLAFSFEIQRSTVQDGANKYLPPYVREHTARIVKSRQSISITELNSLKLAWMQMWNTERHLLDADVNLLARMLFAKSEAIGKDMNNEALTKEDKVNAE